MINYSILKHAHTGQVIAMMYEKQKVGIGNFKKSELGCLVGRCVSITLFLRDQGLSGSAKDNYQLFHERALAITILISNKREWNNCFIKFLQGRCLLLLLRIRSAHLHILGFPIADAY